jgi:hypothetical protein
MELHEVCLWRCPLPQGARPDSVVTYELIESAQAGGGYHESPRRFVDGLCGGGGGGEVGGIL